MEMVRTKPLVEGALLAALVALLGLLSFYTGFGWLQPIPVLFAYLHNGARNAFLVAVVGAGLLALWIGPVSAVATFGFVTALGLAPGWSLRRGAAAGVTIGTMALALICSSALAALAILLIWHSNLWVQLWAALHELIDAHSTQFRWGTGMSPAQFEALLLQLAPAAVMFAALVQAGAVYILSVAVLRRLGHPLPQLPAFAAWRAPRWLIWPFAVAITARLVLSQKVPEAIAVNLTLALTAVYSVAGLALAYGWLRRRGMARRTVVVVLLGGIGLCDALAVGAFPAVLGVVASLYDDGSGAADSGGDEGESA